MSSYPLTQVGGHAFTHRTSADIEREYDRLRDQARREHSKRQSCFDRAHEAYERGDGALAHELSEEGKRHGDQMDRYNKQASEFIFRENNAQGRVDEDEIDLHGQFVEEAEDILETRIRAARAQGQSHLHVIVGKGNHSANHVQRLKPRMEKLCREMGLRYRTEDNAGRIYVNLTGGPAEDVPSRHGHGPYPGQAHHGRPHGGGHHRPPQQENEVEEIARKAVPKIFRAIKSCCIVM
ncbi:hypothetical protein BDY21DRAFT_330503 [Lineolata rhizophorae]|uniref:Smr domain-containing protein n=1 Tax=Lineolata rhizophorae TaxID=578093 RepID=A0A6A6PDR1_9PEZI|nr:hypothetical protein BDY21DRAFT_330503 [Lineolata rhizophorae]